MSIVGSVFGVAEGSAALDKAVRLFEVLTIDNPEPAGDNLTEGLFYIDIS